jgi:hypothetical protein
MRHLPPMKADDKYMGLYACFLFFYIYLYFLCFLGQPDSHIHYMAIGLRGLNEWCRDWHMLRVTAEEYVDVVDQNIYVRHP